MFKLNDLGLENLKNFVTEQMIVVWNTANEVPEFAAFVKQYEDEQIFSMYFMQYILSSCGYHWKKLQHFTDIRFDEPALGGFIKLGVNFVFDKSVNQHPVFKNFSDPYSNKVGKYLQENISTALPAMASGINGIGTQCLADGPEIYCNLKYIPKEDEMEAL